MSNHISKRPHAGQVQVIIQEAMRSAVLAPTEREGFDMLAEALRKVSDLAGTASITRDNRQ